MFLSSPCSSRNELGRLLNKLGLTGQGVEVGTHRGTFARTLLSTWRGRKLYCVDPWDVPPGYEEQVRYLEGTEGREKDYLACAETLSEFRGRVALWRKTSLQSLSRFEDNCLDFVYLDGDHTPPHVQQDLSWYDKLKPGGMLAGHDFLCPGPPGQQDDWGRFIQPAVIDLAREVQVSVYLIVEAGGLPWSYYLFKPGGRRDAV